MSEIKKCGCEHHHEEEHETCCVEHHHEHKHEHHSSGECCCGVKNKEDRELENADYKFNISGLDCANCAMKVETAILNEEYIKDASLNFSTMKLHVVSDLEEKEVFDKLNALVGSVEKGVSLTNNNEEVSVSSHKDGYIIVGGIIALIIALIIENTTTIPSIIFFIVAYLIAGYEVLLTAIRNILKGDFFDENFLMSIATIGAIVVGSYEEAVAVMLFYDLGEFFQSMAVNSSRKSIHSLMNLHTEYATLLKDGKEIKIKSEDIKVDDELLIKVGERIPVDGVVVFGNSVLDTSALTGESLPRKVKENDEVLSGCLNNSAVFTMKATKEVRESTVSKVLELVENAANKKAPIEKFITKFSKVYTPIVVLLAILIVAIPTMIQGIDTFHIWLYRGCTFLVISCPCALVISIPLGLFAGIGAASKKGVLVKGGNYLEKLSEIDTVVFDKTGTITKGNFQVQEMIGVNTLEYAAYGECLSNHPIALSIVETYGKALDSKRIHDYKEIAGHGVSVIFDNKLLLVGNEKLLIENNINFERVNVIGSIVYVAYDGNYIGYLVIRDEIKETSKEAIEKLKGVGITKTIMLTGDKKEIAQSIAKEVAIDVVHAELLPQDKVSVLETYLDKNHVVGFVGDGINDAPVLMRSDIGIAMGGIGSDAAIEASDIVLMNDDLSTLPSAIKIARKTKGILKQNIIFSIGIKVLVLILTAFGLANMWMGVFADVGVTLIAILNAMRALKI